MTCNDGAEHGAGCLEMCVLGLFVKVIPKYSVWWCESPNKQAHTSQGSVLEKKWVISSRKHWRSLFYTELTEGGASWFLTKLSFRPSLWFCCDAQGHGEPTMYCGESKLISCLLLSQLEHEKLENGCVKVELCSTEAGAAVPGGGTGRRAAAPRFPLEPFQFAWLYSCGTVSKSRSQEVVKPHYYSLLLVNIYAVVMSHGSGQVPAVSPALCTSAQLLNDWTLGIWDFLAAGLLYGLVWFSGHGADGLMVGLGDLSGLFQP